MSGTEEAILSGRDSHPAGGNSVLCFGQVHVFSSYLEGMRLSEKGMGKPLVEHHHIHVNCFFFFHLSASFGSL